MNWLGRSLLSVLFSVGVSSVAHAACDFEFEVKQVESAGPVQAVGLNGQSIQVQGGWAALHTLNDEDPLRALSRSTGRLDFCWESDESNAPPVITHCTGSLLEDNFVLTNHHCPSLSEARYKSSYSVALRRGQYYLSEARLVMGLDRSGKGEDEGVRAYPIALTHPRNKNIADADVALLKARGRPVDDWGVTPLDVADRIPAGTPLRIAHHPGGIPMQISTGTLCSVHISQSKAKADELRHVCPTAGGSSGALIRRSSDLAIVGIHNSGGFNVNDPSSHNGGIRIAYALQRLGLQAEFVKDTPTEESVVVVVPPKVVDPKPVSDPDPELSVELEYWHLCRDNEVAAYCEAYLEDYSSGKYKRLASIRLEELRAAASAKLSARAPAKPVDPCSLVFVVSGERCEVVGGKASIVRVAIAEPEYDPCRDFRGTPPKDARCVVQAGQAVWISLAPPTPKVAYGIAAGDWIGGSGSIGASGSSFREVSGAPEMVVIPSGRFEQGSPAGEAGRYDNEGPQREVRIPNPFALGRSEVTVGEWRRFVNATGHVSGNSCQTLENGTLENRSGRGWINPGFSQGDSYPVTCVNWNDAKAYIGWLNGQVSGSPYRLPSESEWEYGARAGSTSARYWGPDASHTVQCGHANGADAAIVRDFAAQNLTLVGAASCDDGFVFTSPVGRFGKNPFGLHDMLGNVWEWTEDCWQYGYSGAPRNGSAWLSSSGGDCDQRVLRGGSWYNDPRGLRSAYRGWFETSNRDSSIGFRVARTLTR